MLNKAMRLSLWGLTALVLFAAPAAQTRDLSDMSSTEIGALQQRLSDGGCFTGAIDGQASAALQNAVNACPSQDPALRIETGMHVGPIFRLSVDQACRIAVTGSLDKTIRVWSLPDARLLRTLRVPIGPGNGGKIYAAAISPDARWIAAAGWDARWEAAHEMNVYIFDAASGALVTRVGPMGGATNHLVFSPDGRWLAAMNSTGGGMKVIDTQTWRVIAKDDSYTRDSYGAAFGSDGRLYTVADDGKLRRYSPGPAFKKEKEVTTNGDPQSVDIDPRGQLLIVGIYDVNKVDVYDAATLTFRFTADTKGLETGDLSGVAWSSDGASFVAGGKYPLDGKSKLMTFGRDGKRIGDGVEVSDSTIMSPRPCAAAMAVAAQDPGFGLVDSNRQMEFWKPGVSPDMRDKLDDAFTIAPNATQVRFGLGHKDLQPVIFNLGQATVTNAPNPAAGFISPLVVGLPILNWRNEYEPTFGGKKIVLEQYERSRALAIRPDNTGFVLGAEFNLRSFDAQGQLRWQEPVPGVPFGVNLSADGRIIVAAYDDGTIRWHRWSDGKELLALFVNRNTKVWVAWTPSGYYMASPGGEDLIGWHINRGWNQTADFFPASRFRDRFNRPDIVHLVLTTLDEDAAVKQANGVAHRQEDTRPIIEHLPPIIRIIDPSDGTHVRSGNITLNYAYRSPSGQPVERIDVLLDGRAVKSIGLPVQATAPDAEITGSLSVTLAHQLTEVGLIAWTSDHSSQPERVRLTWEGAPSATDATHRLYALVVGVSAYAESDMALAYAAKDARDFATALQGQKGGYYADVQTKVLTDRDVTRASVIHGLDWLEKAATNPNDVTVLYLAGHGLTDEKQTYWFIPSDGTADNVRAKGISQDDVRRSLQNLAGKVLWFLDTCHAGSAAKRPPMDVNVLVNTVSAAENGGIVVFASSTGRQTSVERSDWGNGAFTKAIVEGIALGKADLLGKGFITTSSLDTFVENRVQELTDGGQSPVMERPPEEPDFAIAKVHKN
ncbi:MAG TPA: caspase family protein [Xanthobacteraceae bacterium]|nr:caspase family protein [Xanthobacteraceae bacterium]